MKPDLVTCTNCGKPINKGRWCSDKCRMAYKRLVLPEQEPEQNSNPNTNKPEQIVPEQPKGEQPEQLTKTDQTFYDRAMRDFKQPYYGFGGPLRQEVCARCGAKFRTTLSMLIYCSYQHYSDTVSGRPK